MMTQPDGGPTTELLLPVIRVRPLALGSREVVAVTATAIAVGRVGAADVQSFLQEVARTGSDPAARPQFPGGPADDPTPPASPLNRIPLQKVRSVTRTRAGWVSPSDWVRYVVTTDEGSHRFQVAAREEANVERVLTALVGDRFDPVTKRRPSGFDAGLVVGAVVAAAGLALFSVNDGFLILGFVAGLLTVLMGLVGWVRGWQVARPAARQRRDRAGQAPFRSPPLGWFLKILGLVWLVVVFLSSGFLTSLDAPHRPPGSPGLAYLVYPLYLPGIVLIYWGYRLCLRIFAPGRHPDPRPPIVYLRGFDDDGRGTFQPDSFLARIHGIESHWGGNAGESAWTRRARLPFWLLHPVKLFRLVFNIDRHSAEEVLAAAFRPHGPFVAIGRPGERLATPGADRMYVTDDRWQQVVLDYLGRCRAVVLQPSGSEGVRWEIDQVFGRVDRHRILLSTINFHQKPNGFEEFRATLRQKFGLDLPAEVPFLAEPAFVYFEADGSPRVQPVVYTSPLWWSFTNTAVDVGETFHAFLRGWDGGPRPEPLPPRSFGARAALSALIPAAIVALPLWLATTSGGFGPTPIPAPDRIVDQVAGLVPITDLTPLQLPPEEPKPEPPEEPGSVIFTVKGVRCSVTLSTKWKRVKLDPARVKVLGEAARLEGLPAIDPHFLFSFGEGQAEFSVGVLEEPLDFANRGQVASSEVKQARLAGRDGAGDARVASVEKRVRDGRDWLEVEINSEGKGGTNLVCLTSHNGRTLRFHAWFRTEDTKVENRVRGVLDSVQILR